MLLANEWEDYEIIGVSNGMKLERWKDIYLLRPDPQIIYNTSFDISEYDAIYHRSNKGGGYWEYKNNISNMWEVKYKDLTFNIKIMGFKHTGIFPEQAVNWDYMINKIKNSNRNINVLNLFAYTGCASVACLYGGASVVHVDSSKGIVELAKENVKSSGLDSKPIRYIVDDVIKFVKREIRRGNKYDAVIMDPPSYGKGSNGEVWDIEKDLYELVRLCNEILSDNPLFFLINSYTTGLSPNVLSNILKITVNTKYKGIVSCGEVGLPIKNSDCVLPCGIYGRWEKDE
ncbi:MAG: class I SAM-dependent methyltransferase [Bacilli bacterium]|nr:class I SAM-dependent methyltransferase [Bacilli bacterium]